MLISDPLPPSGIRVPMRATFTGIKGIPVLAVAHNNASPHLLLFEDHLEYRVIFKRSPPLSAIAGIGMHGSTGTQTIEIAWKDSFFTFSGKVATDEWLLALVSYFARRELPLSPEAQRYLQQHREQS